jgi:hypothetical protein
LYEYFQVLSVFRMKVTISAGCAYFNTLVGHLHLSASQVLERVVKSDCLILDYPMITLIGWQVIRRC